MEHDADIVMFLCGEEYYLSKSVSELVSKEYMFFYDCLKILLLGRKGIPLSLSI